MPTMTSEIESVLFLGGPLHLTQKQLVPRQTKHVIGRGADAVTYHIHRLTDSHHFYVAIACPEGSSVLQTMLDLILISQTD